MGNVNTNCLRNTTLSRQSSFLSKFSTESRHAIEEPLRISAFNVRRFGKAKMKKDSVVKKLVQIILQYDLIFIQEITDVTQTAIKDLLAVVNESGENIYEMEISERLGTGSSCEQYAFFYKRTRLKVAQAVVFPDTEKKFNREPFIVKFECPSLAENVENITCIGIHTQPKFAAQEIKALYDVVKWTSDIYQTTNIIILGDLNAGSPYVRQSDWKDILLKSSDFDWLIEDHVDTTVSSNLAAYDRIIVCGSLLRKIVIPGTATVFRYDSNKEQVLEVSDHYPIEFSLRTKVHSEIVNQILSFTGIIVKERLDSSKKNKNLRSRLSKSFPCSSPFQGRFYGKYYFEATYESHKVEDIILHLEGLRKEIPALISYSSLSLLKYRLKYDNNEKCNETNENLFVKISFYVKEQSIEILINIPRKLQ